MRVKYDLELMEKIKKDNGRRTPYSYKFSSDQNRVFYELRKKYRWNKFNVHYMKRLIACQKYNTLSAFKKVCLERNYV